jgi:tetratricopeptide (TPR) repeat protein
VLFILFIPSVAIPQTPGVSAKFRLAQGYEQAGNLEQAARIYQELFSKDSANYVFFESLSRVYIQLKQYGDALVLLRRRLTLSPNDINIRNTLASVYYKAGKEADAFAEWEGVLEIDPTNPNIYRSVAVVLVENRLLERAAVVYRRARVACNDPVLFTLDLAQLLAITMDYAGATREFLGWLEQNPTQLSFVQSKMSAFTGKEEARNAACDVVREELQKKEDPRLYELLAWLYMEGKQFSQAFDVYKQLDAATNAKGGVIYAFAERAFKERAFDVAAQAYLEAIRIPVAPARLPYAKLGYASCLKELGSLADTLTRSSVSGVTPATESQPRYAGAIAYYQQMIAEYPQSEFSAKSHYNIGLIEYEQFFDLDGALRAFRAAETDLPATGQLRLEVALRIAEVLVCKGDTAAAAAKLRMVASALNAIPDQQDEANFHLAEIAYFGGNFAGAIGGLESISTNVKANFANDALALRAFLSENLTTAEPALQLFARADFLARQCRYAESIPQFLTVIERFPQALLIDDALMKVGFLQAKTGQYANAIATYETLLTKFSKSSIALDRAQFSIGDVYQYGLKDNAKAIAAYEKLLADYPQSLLADQARQRIRALRGDLM